MTTIQKINKPGCDHYEVLDDSSKVVGVLHKTELEAPKLVEKTLTDYLKEAKTEYEKVKDREVTK